MFLPRRFQPMYIFLSFVSFLACFSGPVQAVDKFEWFRCDSCRATFHQLQRRLVNQTRTLKDYEFLELLEDVCENEFTNRNYGVKQHEEKQYLFGPGIVDHLGPDKGFGQMGMGDYHERLKSYCYMHVEKVGEDKLRHLGAKIDKELLCKGECKSNASGASDPESDDSYLRSKEKAKKLAKPSTSDSETKKGQGKAESHSTKAKTKKAASSPTAGKSQKAETSLASTSATTEEEIISLFERIDSLDADGLKAIMMHATQRLWEKSAATNDQETKSSDL